MMLPQKFLNLPRQAIQQNQGMRQNPFMRFGGQGMGMGMGQHRFGLNQNANPYIMDPGRPQGGQMPMPVPPGAQQAMNPILNFGPQAANPNAPMQIDPARMAQLRAFLSGGGLLRG